MKENRMPEPAIEMRASGNPESWLGKLGTDALLLGALSAGGYCVAFAFEAGYADHFGYPTYLITPTPNVIVTALAAVMIVVAGLFPPFIDMLESKNLGNRKLGLVALLVIFVGFSAAYLFTMSNYKLSSLIPLPFGLALLVLMRWAGAADAKHGHVTGPKSRAVAGVLFLALLTYQLATFFGVMSATNQKAFYFLKTKPDFAVVRLYDSMAVAVRYDTQKQQFVREYLAIRLGDELKELDLVRTVLKADRKPVVKDD
jgi:hypothetical protein